MENAIDNTIYIIDENGQEVEMKILFTFEMKGENFVIVYKDELNEDNLYAFKYDDNGNLIPVTEQEMSMIDEIVAAFDSEECEEDEEN